MKNNFFWKLSGRDGGEKVEEEIISMVNEGHEQGVFHEAEAEMISNIFEFGDKEASDIMTNRSNILAIDATKTLAETVDYLLEETKSRFPVYEDNIDHIVGILHFKDAMRAQRIPGNNEKKLTEVEGLLREPVFVTETKSIADLFQDMQKTKTQMVIVLDEYGQTLGLIAMEDILEEIVGNIMDEYDEEEELISETENKDEYLTDGMMRLEDLEEKLDISYGEQEVDTLNGYLTSLLDRIPEDGETLILKDDMCEYRVLSVENHMMKEVLVKKLSEDEKAEREKEEE